MESAHGGREVAQKYPRPFAAVRLAGSGHEQVGGVGGVEAAQAGQFSRSAGGDGAGISRAARGEVAAGGGGEDGARVPSGRFAPHRAGGGDDGGESGIDRGLGGGAIAGIRARHRRTSDRDRARGCAVLRQAGDVRRGYDGRGVRAARAARDGGSLDGQGAGRREDDPLRRGAAALQ